jgi:hypothetical protein
LTAIGPKTATIVTDVATSGSTVYLDKLVEVALQLGDEFGALAYGEGSLLLTRHGASIPGSTSSRELRLIRAAFRSGDCRG